MFFSDADIDQAVALLMALEENEVEVVHGVEENHTEFERSSQKQNKKVYHINYLLLCNKI